MPEQVKRRRSKWDRPEAEKPSFFSELIEGVQKHWPAVLGFLVCFGLFLGLLHLITREYTGDVSGNVTCGGKPIPYGRITFVSQSGKQRAVSAMIKKGRYELKNCPRGPAKISVESLKVPKAAPPPNDPAAKAKLPAPADPLPADMVGQHLPIPPEFGNADTSRLEFKVGWGSQEHNIDLPAKH